ncbi:hypothetical protein [Streptomyces mayteni]
MSDRIALMAAAELRDALDAHLRGDVVTATAALMNIDAESWAAIERRLALLGGSLAELLAVVAEQRH